ncbi:MAG: hypothetical protein Tsb002_32440 [Wenzhouxiangellaceae bacterium]
MYMTGRHWLSATLLLFHVTVWADNQAAVDYLSLAQGAVPVTIGEQAMDLRVGLDRALQIVDGDHRGFGLTPKPGDELTELVFIYRLPALTRFTRFAIPNVLETPSPSQTFIRQVKIEGATDSVDGPYSDLAGLTLTQHTSKSQLSVTDTVNNMAVTWVRITLSGGLDIQRDSTFFEFSELLGYGTQDEVPLANGFDGQWKGRGLALALTQDGAVVSGCYERDGALRGTVSGNVLRATGETLAGIGSVFVLTLTADGGILGVRSTNGAPFRLYSGSPVNDAGTRCEEPAQPVLGCDAIIHGINFDFDSAVIRRDSQPLLNSLAAALEQEEAPQITVIGHTSSEGNDAYNMQLSQRRADAVVAALIEHGLAADRLAAAGKGEQQPIADNATEAGRSLNRRVEIGCETVPE